MVPWICDDNAEEFVDQLESTSARLCMGHLELPGFYANKDYKCEHGTDPKHFNKFDCVFSGHFHKKSTKGNITYLGNPYQLYWNDDRKSRVGGPQMDKDGGSAPDGATGQQMGGGGGGGGGGAMAAGGNECWEPRETDGEKMRARSQGEKVGHVGYVCVHYLYVARSVKCCFL